jgi:metal-responsive CopG/Arc/MetJ family transcriptional regulator
MEILSISIDDETRKRLAEIQKRLGFKSRSKLLRDAVQSLVKDYEALEGLNGTVEIVFVLSYKEAEKNHVSNTLHEFKENIKSELHQHGSESCIDVLNVSAEASKVRKMFAVLKKNRCIYSVVYSVVSVSKAKR